MALLPSAFYLACFLVLTFPLILKFSTHLFADPWDGVQFHWNLWWVNEALTVLHQSPWHTHYLHHPFGVTLLPHALNLFNGLLAIVLLRVMTLLESYNLIVILSFVLSGTTAFWLAYYFTRSYWPSILAGFIFTFSSYHFAHMDGHLNLVSIQWLPLFVLCWYHGLRRPGVPIAVGSAATLFAVLLCDYYYFLYSVLIGTVMFVWHGLRSRNALFFLQRRYLRCLTVFVAGTLATSGPLVLSLILLSISDPLGGHDPRNNSMDLLAPFVPGSHWLASRLTKVYWRGLPGDANENSVYLGWAVIFILVYVWRTRRSYTCPAVRMWFFIFACFAVLALGPVLHVWGTEYPGVALPYALLESAFPPLQVSGVPVRMMIVSTLAAAVLCAFGVTRLWAHSERARIVTACLILLLVLEYLPKPRDASLLPVPAFAVVLKEQPGSGGVLDTVSGPFDPLFHQTVHEKPIAFGLLSRIPASVERKNEELKRAFNNEEYGRLRDEYQIRYLVMAAATDLESKSPSIRTLYRDAKVALYELGADRR